MDLTSFLTKSLCIDEASLISFASTAPHRYKVYDIPKRSGRGKRTIAHPSKPLKFIQRLIVSELEKNVVVHDSAFAYRKNLSIKDNAMEHSNSKYLLKMDFKDFFPSITPEVLFQELQRSDINLSDSDRELVSNLLFFKLRKNSRLRLSIGAPSSPLISNFVMYSFDCAIFKICKNQKINYSRYADDITFSSNIKNILFTVPQIVEETLKSQGYNDIKVNSEKTIFSSKGHNRHVTGITLSNNGNLSVGRDKKRDLSAGIHRFSRGKMSEGETSVLLGQLSFAFFIEPQFRERMQRKYGEGIFEELRTAIRNCN